MIQADYLSHITIELAGEARDPLWSTEKVDHNVFHSSEPPFYNIHEVNYCCKCFSKRMFIKQTY